MSVYKHGPSWRYDFQLDHVRYVQVVGPDRRIAEQAEAVAKSRAYEHRYEHRYGLKTKPLPPMTVEELWEKNYGKSLKTYLAHSTWLNTQSVFRQINRLLGDVLLSRLTRSHIEDYITERQKTVSSNMVRLELLWLRRLCNAAIRSGQIKVSPAKEVRLPRLTAQPDRILSKEEEKRLWDSITDTRLQTMIKLALYAGLRRQEVCALRWGEADLKHRVLVVQQPKTGIVKVVPMIPMVWETLQALRPPEYDSEAYVFPGRGGKPIDRSILSRAFREAIKKARIKPIRFHDLRHTIATRLSEQGVDLPTIGAILGHKPPYRETLRYIAHTSQKRMREGLQVLQNPTTNGY